MTGCGSGSVDGDSLAGGVGLRVSARVDGAVSSEPDEPDRGADAREGAHPGVDAEAEDGVGRVDAQVLEPEPPERVHAEVQRERLAATEREPALRPQEDPEQRE